jgi:hypothetical protein
VAGVAVAEPPRVPTSRLVCTPGGVCTSLREEGLTGEGVALLRLEERLPQQVAAEASFGLWLAWPVEAERQRALLSREGGLQLEVVTPAGRLELFMAPRTLVRRAPREPAALLVYVAHEPAEQGPLEPALPDVVRAARARGLLNEEQQQVLVAREQALQRRLEPLLQALESFRLKPAEPKAREALLSSLVALPGEELEVGARALAPETFLTPAQRTRLRARGGEVEGRHWLEYEPGLGLAYRLHVQGYSVEQLVHEWNAGLRGPAAGVEELPRPRLEVERAHRYEDVSFTLEVRADSESTRLDQVLARLLQVPGVRRAPGSLLPSAR